MIKHTELRCGNLVTDQFYDSFKTVLKVESINEKGINLFIEDNRDWPELCKYWMEPEHKSEELFGIPLSEEWLIRAGFEKYSDKEFYIYTSKENEVRFYKSDSDWNLAYFITETRYVHQLQNLYFWLTGEELTFKDL